MEDVEGARSCDDAREGLSLDERRDLVLVGRLYCTLAVSAGYLGGSGRNGGSGEELCLGCACSVGGR